MQIALAGLGPGSSSGTKEQYDRSKRTTSQCQFPQLQMQAELVFSVSLSVSVSLHQFAI